MSFGDKCAHFNCASRLVISSLSFPDFLRSLGDNAEHSRVSVSPFLEHGSRDFCEITPTSLIDPRGKLRRENTVQAGKAFLFTHHIVHVLQYVGEAADDQRELVLGDVDETFSVVLRADFGVRVLLADFDWKLKKRKEKKKQTITIRPDISRASKRERKCRLTPFAG